MKKVYEASKFQIIKNVKDIFILFVFFSLIGGTLQAQNIQESLLSSIEKESLKIFKNNFQSSIELQDSSLFNDLLINQSVLKNTIKTVFADSLTAALFTNKIEEYWDEIYAEFILDSKNAYKVIVDSLSSERDHIPIIQEFEIFENHSIPNIKSLQVKFLMKINSISFVIWIDEILYLEEKGWYISKFNSKSIYSGR